MSTCTAHCIYIIKMLRWILIVNGLIRVNRENKSGLRLSGLWHIMVWIRITYKLCASEAMNLYDECSGIQGKILLCMPLLTRCVIDTVLTIPSVSCVMISCVTHVCLVSVCVYTCVYCDMEHTAANFQKPFELLYTNFLYIKLTNVRFLR